MAAIVAHRYFHTFQSISLPQALDKLYHGSNSNQVPAYTAIFVLKFLVSEANNSRSSIGVVWIFFRLNQDCWIEEVNGTLKD